MVNKQGQDLTKNVCGKTRNKQNPYEIWQSADGSWEWRVLKKYQKPALEKKNPYARWFCAVKSPYTFGTYDLGDVYISEITKVANLTFIDEIQLEDH